jgi:hypothetical protein
VPTSRCFGMLPERHNLNMLAYNVVMGRPDNRSNQIISADVYRSKA